MIIINIIIYTQGEPLNRYNFLYDHGVESIAALVTFLAFALTFISILHNNKKDKANEIKKNHKTLQMIDLISGKHIDNIEYIKKQLTDVKNGTTLQICINGETPAYQIELQNIESSNIMHDKRVFQTYSFDKYCVLESFKRIKENDTKQIVENYKDEITKILSNQHLNMNLESLDKINNKINTLSKLLKKLEMIDKYIEIIEISAQEEMNDPNLIQTEKTEEEKNDIEEFNSSIIKKKLEEIQEIINYLEKSRKKLE